MGTRQFWWPILALVFLSEARANDVVELPGHGDGVRCVAFSPNGKWLATGSADHTVRLWDAATGGLRRTIPGPTEVSSLAFTPDGKSLVIVYIRGAAGKIWDLGKDKLQRPIGEDRIFADSIAVSPDSRWVVFPSAYAPTVYDAETGRPVFERGSKPKGRTEFSGHGIIPREPASPFESGDSLLSIVFYPDGKSVATGSQRGGIALWDFGARKLRSVVKAHAGAIHALAISKDCKLLASASEDQTVGLWDAASGKPLQTLRPKHEVYSVAFSPDGKTLAVAGKSKDVTLWDVGSGERKAVLTGHRSRVNCVAFSPDGKLLATGSWDRTARIWKVPADK